MTMMSRNQLLETAIKLAEDIEKAHREPLHDTGKEIEVWWVWTLDDNSTIKIGLIAWKEDVAPDRSTMRPRRARLIHTDGDEQIESFDCDQSHIVDCYGSPLRLRSQLKALQHAA